MSANKFVLNVFCPQSRFAQIKQSIPALSDIQIIHELDSALTTYERKSIDRLVVWITPLSTATLISGMISAAILDHVICIGEKIASTEALRLGRAGINQLFDVVRNKDDFERALLEKYEQWRSRRAVTEIKEIDLESHIIGESNAIRFLRELTRKVSVRERLTVLVLGETGSGKGLVARTIHDLSPRKMGPFVEINCSAIPDTLVEAELFGHEKGAFTDAHRSRRGIFEMAHGGTLFLDEIGFLKPEVQVKLLKALEDKRFRRLGGEKDIQVDCRIIAGTSVDLLKAVEANTFRSDLYYRLNVFPIRVPPLRERSADVILLAEHFREHFCREHQVKAESFDEDARRFILSGIWKGNVRELKHAVERAVILSEGGQITAEAFNPEWRNFIEESKIESAQVTNPSRNILMIELPEEGKTLEEIQKEIIVKVLEMTKGNRSSAARLLKISRSRLLRKIGNSEDDE